MINFNFIKTLHMGVKTMMKKNTVSYLKRRQIIVMSTVCITAIGLICLNHTFKAIRGSNSRMCSSLPGDDLQCHPGTPCQYKEEVDLRIIVLPLTQ